MRARCFLSRVHSFDLFVCCASGSFRSGVLKVWFLSQEHLHYQGICQKCMFLGLLNQKLWGGAQKSVLTSLPGDSNAHPTANHWRMQKSQQPFPFHSQVALETAAGERESLQLSIFLFVGGCILITFLRNDSGLT